MNSKVRIRVESGVERAVRIQACDVVPRHSQNGTKLATDKNLTVRLHGGGSNIGPDGTEIEGLVESAAGSQTGDGVARHRRSAVRRKRCKIAADKNPAVRLRRD